MSMIGCFYAVSDKDLAAVIADPKKLTIVWGLPPSTKKTSFLERLFRAAPTAKQSEPTWIPEQKPEQFDVDKAWHGIHFLLTGTAWDGTGPLAFLLHGGNEIEQDAGYGPPHGFTSGEVKEIQQSLQKIDPEALYNTANQADFSKNEIYPESIWKDESKEECIGYVTGYLKELKTFINKTAESNRALIVYLG